MGVTSVTGVRSEHLGVDRLIGPRWTERHEEAFEKIKQQYIDHATMVPPIAEATLQHRKWLSALIWTQLIMFGALVVLGLHVFVWK